MSPIDLQSKEGRKSFISDNLSDLLTGINDTYGPMMLEELLKRIEFTINEFNEEINNAFEALKNKDIRRQDVYSKIKSNETVNIDSKQSKTEWELKLEEIESTTK